jgi:hypothetical protein
MSKNMTLEDYEMLTEEEIANLSPEEQEKYDAQVDKELRKWSYKASEKKDDALYSEAFNDLFKRTDGG